MNKSYPFTELQTKLQTAQKILIALPTNPSLDQVAGGLSLFLALKEHSKSPAVLCATPMTVEFNQLVGVDQVSDKFLGTDLVVNFNYLMENIEKVSYNDENGRLNLVIQPKVNSPSLTPQMVSFSYAGAGTNLIFTIGVSNLQLLQQAGKSDFSNVAIVNIDNDPNFSQFGEIGVYDPQAGSISEIILGLILGLGLSISPDMAQNLLNGIWRATRGLTALELEADAYEAVAICLRGGAHRPTDFMTKEQDFRQKPTAQFKPKPTPAWNQPPQAKPAAPVAPVPTPPVVKQNPPADWFEPKIYRGANIS